MIFFFLPFLLVGTLHTIGNLFTIKLNLISYEKPIYGLGLLIFLINFCYFNLDLSLKYFIFIIFSLFIIGIIVSYFQKQNLLSELNAIFKDMLLLQIFFSLIAILYGEQFYVFRGNIHDHFAYLTSGLMFNEYSFQELLKMNNPSYISNLDDNKFYLSNSLHIINSRPSAQLIIGLLMNIDFIDPIKIGYIFKSTASLLVLLSCFSFFQLFLIKDKLNLFVSYSFLLSFFYFYNYEIDAYSLILSLPFLYLILKQSFNLDENTINFNKIFYYKYIFLWSIYFIIYPNGAIIFAVPIFFYILYLVLKNKFDFSIIIKLFLFLILFLLLIVPTFESTVMYLYKSEIPVGFNHKMDFWGYYGAFILGKDNPIHDYSVVVQIKELWRSGLSINQILKSIYNVNIENDNHFFVLNILPSILGMFHFSSSSAYGYFNYFLVIFLVILNFFFIKNIFLNIKIIYKSKESFYVLYKFLIIYFTLFFFYLVVNTQFWPAIKLYFVFSPLFFILISFKFKEDGYPVSSNFILFLLMMLPLYKYSDFNSGIGRIDSFPSIIKKENKTKINWSVDRDKLMKCQNLEYDFDEKFKKIYISIIHSKKTNGTNNNKNVNCKIQFINNNFKIKTL